MLKWIILIFLLTKNPITKNLVVEFTLANNKIYSDVNLDLSFKEKIEKIIQTQDKFFNKKAKPYNIFLINSSNSQFKGTTKSAHIIVAGDFNTDNNESIRVIAHELVHRYIGNIILQNKDHELEYKWFFEGFTEYLAVQSLLYSKFINDLEYLKIINDTLEKYFNSPLNNIRFDKIQQQHIKDKQISVLSYYKGFIIAFILDEKIKEKSDHTCSIKCFLNELILTTASNNYVFETSIFQEILKHYLSKDYIEQILSSINNPKILENLLPKKIFNDQHLVKKYIDQYQTCFDLSKTLESRFIHGVDDNSDCYQKGLRNGQILRCYSINYNSGLIYLGTSCTKNNKETIKIEAIKKSHLIPSYNFN
jgi:predicted metalloprotease with PDZ domain